tara:strand:+ start:2034 stop:2621 length:588 start_codon:yes stop_codon:yes gene_type:complete
MCSAIEKVTARVLQENSDFKWLSSARGSSLPFEYNSQGWSTRLASYIVVKCDSVSVIDTPTARATEATVRIAAFCKAEIMEYGESTETDGSGADDTLTIIHPLISSADHARKIAKYNIEEVSKVLAMPLSELIENFDLLGLFYEGNNPNFCEGDCPVFSLLDISVEGEESESSGAVVSEEIIVKLVGILGEHAPA